MLNEHEFTVTRQLRWHDGLSIVEVSQGGIDYSGPDALCEKYKGEFKTFTGMTPAVKVAIEIAKQWQADEQKSKNPKTIYIATGCTHGMGLTFEEQEFNDTVAEELLKHAQEFDEKLPKCVCCGEFLGDERWGSEFFDERDCCSEYCAEKTYYDVESETEA